MENIERTVASVCGSVGLEGLNVKSTIRDSMTRCLKDEVIFDFAVVYVAGARSSYHTFHKTAVDEDDPFLYQYSCTLVNRLNIRDEELLMSRIRDVSALRIAESERYPFIEMPNLKLLKRLHQHILGDIFPWAGELRSTGTEDPRYCRAEYIESSCNDLLSKLKEENYLSDLSEEGFVERLAHYMNELHVIMPFRYGNGLVIREFMNYVAIMNGYYLDYSKTCRSLMDVALKFSFNGESQMIDIVKSIITNY